MINTLRSEWIKLRTIQVHWVLAAVALLFPITVVTLVATFGDISVVQSDEVADLIVGLSVVSAMLLGATAAISLTSEYNHSTIRPTYAATPSRARVIMSKVALNSLAAAAITGAVVVICWIVASTVLNSRGVSVSLGDDGVTPALIAIVVLGVIVSLFGFGLGLIIRNPPTTVSLFLLWPLLIEGLIALLFFFLGWDGASDYLPYRAALEATGTNPGTSGLGRPMAFVWFGAVSLALIGLGTWLDQRRDA